MKETVSLPFLRRTWAEINLNALENNVKLIRKFCGNKKIIAVVKANAYGHDDDIICSELHRLGINIFAVSNIWEAEDLREILPEAEILVFGYTERAYMHIITQNNLIHTAGSVKYAKELNSFAAANGTAIRVHVKINTGMTRIGIDSEEELKEILSLSNLKCEALYTHFAAADSTEEDDVRYTNAQEEKIAYLAKKYNLPFHSQNSGGILYHGNYGGDFVRTGIIMYGCVPNRACEVPKGFMPVMSLKSAVCQIKQIPAGTAVSYGCTFIADKPLKTAVIPIGYADGLPRALSNCGTVMINGCPAHIIGRVCMDQIIVDVTGINVKTGDEAVIFSGDYPETDVDNIADKLGTIGYELLCSIGHRVPRAAVRDGAVTKVIRYR